MIRATAFALTLAAATPVQASPPPLAENDYINDRLFAAAVGDEIRKACPSISARMVTVLIELQRLKSYARRQGYTDDQMEAYVENKAEQDKMRARRNAYLEANGAVKGEPETYCAIGEREIADDSLIGSLLRAK